MMRKPPALALIVGFLAASCGGGTAAPPSHPTASPPGASIPAHSAGTLAATGRLGAPRAAQTATLLPNGNVLIAGGMARNGAFYATAELYQPPSQSFAPTGTMTTVRVGQRAILLRNGKVLISGGSDGSSPLATAELYDPATGRFTLTGPMRTRRSGHVMAMLSDGRVLVASGYDGHAYVRSAEIYRPSSGTFTPTGDLLEPINGPAVTLRTGKVLISGGAVDVGGPYTAFARAELYDPASGTFSATGDMTQKREKHSATLLLDGKVLITGGNATSAWQLIFTSSEIYDPARGTFSASGAMDTGRFKHQDSVVLLSNGQVLVAGGGDHPELYDPSTNAFSRAAGQYDTARYFMTATLLQSGQVLVAGGYDRGITATSSAWIYQP